MSTQGPNNYNNMNFNVADLASQISSALNMILDALSEGSSRVTSVNEETSRIINESALQMSSTANDLNSQCRILADTINKLQGATNTTATTLENLSESIKQTILSSETLQPLMDNLNDLSTKIQELTDNIKDNIGQSINITQSADANGASGGSRGLVGGNTNATNIINIVQGGAGNRGTGTLASDKPSKYAGFIDSIVSSMVTGFENSKFGKLSLAGIIRDAIALGALLIGHKFGPVFGLIAGFTGLLATKFVGNFLTTMAGLKLAKWGGMSKEALANLPVKGLSGNLAKSVSLNGWKATFSSAGGWVSKLGTGFSKLWGWLNKVVNLPVARVLGKVLGVIGIIFSVFDIFKGVNRVKSGDKAGGWDIAGGVAGIVSAIGFMLIPVLGPIGLAIGIIGAILAGIFKWLGGRAKKKDKDNAEIIKGLNKEEKDNYWDKETSGRISNGYEGGGSGGSGGSVGARKNGGKGTTSILGGNYAISSGYGNRVDPVYGGNQFHEGIDIAMPEGTKFKSSSFGKVVAVNTGWNGGFGNNVIVKDAMGNLHQYSHMKDINVKKGQFVTPETFLGTAGSTGKSTGSHVDYRVKKNGRVDKGGFAVGERTDPLEYLRNDYFRAAQGRYILEHTNDYPEIKNYLAQIAEELHKNHVYKTEDAKTSEDRKKLDVVKTAENYSPQNADYSGNSFAMRAFVTNLTSLLGMK